MDVKEFIESGILESFVLGETTGAESTEVMSMAEKHPEVATEIARIEEALFRTAQAGAVSPSKDLRNKILARAPGMQKEPLNAPVGVNPVSISHKRTFSPWAVAASVLLLMSAGLNIWLYSRWNKSEEALSLAMEEKQVLANSYKKADASFKIMQEKMGLMKDPMVMMVEMKGMNHLPMASAAVFWNKQNGHAMLDITSLPEAPTGMQYQLWAIVDGKPVDEGVFMRDTSDHSVHPMKPVQNPQAFAVTIEKMGGSINPNMDQMVLMGAIESRGTQ